MLFTLVLLVAMTFWNGIATLLGENHVDLFDMFAMLSFVFIWILFCVILAVVICCKVGVTTISVSHEHFLLLVHTASVVEAPLR